MRLESARGERERTHRRALLWHKKRRCYPRTALALRTQRPSTSIRTAHQSHQVWTCCRAVFSRVPLQTGPHQPGRAKGLGTHLVWAAQQHPDTARTLQNPPSTEMHAVPVKAISNPPKPLVPMLAGMLPGTATENKSVTELGPLRARSLRRASGRLCCHHEHPRSPAALPPPAPAGPLPVAPREPG